MIEVPIQPFFVFVLVFLRTGFLLTFFPILGETFVPVRIRVLLCAAIALALATVVPVNAGMFPHSIGGFVGLVGTEALLGFGLAFIGKLMFAIVQFAGQIIGQEIGFGVVNSFDPSVHQVTAVAEAHYLLSILLFFGAGFHHIILRALVESFTLLPPGTAMLTPHLADMMLNLGTTLFALSVGFAMPVIAVNFSINVAMGMVGRAVPQMNVFVESFPVRIMAGMSVILLASAFTIGLWQNMFDRMPTLMSNVMKAMH